MTSLFAFGLVVIWLALQHAQGGLSSAIGPAKVVISEDVDPDQMQNNAYARPPNSPLKSSPPACPGKDKLLHVEASDRARKALTGWLAKDTIRLIFIYFDLVVGNLTFHPGSCPHANKSAIVAQTPLAWVLSNGESNGGGSIASHSFAHAYLTLPVSYPRIYSMGILDGHYVGYMRHDVYRMKVVVNPTQQENDVDKNCWNELNKTERASLMLEVVQGFVSELEQRPAENTTKWTMCYTDPTSKNLPPSTSLLVPKTPVYVCQDEDGSMRKLERDSFLTGLFGLFLCLSLAALVFQLYAFSKGIWFLRIWGEKQPKPFRFENGRLFHKEDEFFSNSRLPMHVTVGGLLMSDIVLGRQAFVRMKWILFLAVCFFLYAVWPNLLVQSILNPTSPIVRLGVHSEETFGRNLSCNPNVPATLSLSVISTGFYCSAGPMFSFIYSILLFIDDPSAVGSYIFKAFSLAPLQHASSIFLNIVAFLRVILLFPLKPPSRAQAANYNKDAECCTKLSFVLFVIRAFVLAQLFFWFPIFSIIMIDVVFSFVGEILDITGFRTVCTLVEGPPSSRPSENEKPDGCLPFLFWLVLSLPLIVLYIEGSELLMFLLLSSISLYMTYPLPTFLVVSWLVALVAETQNILHDYRSPMLFIQEKFVEKVMSLAKNHIKLKKTPRADATDEFILTGPRLYLKNKPKNRPAVDWSLFFRLSQKAWDSVCLQLLSHQERNVFSPITKDDGRCVRPVFWSLDVRTDAERNKNPTMLKLQKILWMRFFQRLAKLVFLVTLFLAIIVLLVAFNSLWKDPNPKDTSSLLLTILVVPLYTFVRTKVSPFSLSIDEKLLVEKSLDKELEKCFRSSIVNVSEFKLWIVLLKCLILFLFSFL